ncbi:MAG: DUF2188 domain-containing protein [Aestuariivirga sp.]
MAHEQYLVLSHNDEWKIRFNGRLYGPYESRDAALETAIEVAHAMGEIGIDAQVAVQDTDANVRTAWTYDQDFTTLAR